MTNSIPTPKPASKSVYRLLTEIFDEKYIVLVSEYGLRGGDMYSQFGADLATDFGHVADHVMVRPT